MLRNTSTIASNIVASFDTVVALKWLTGNSAVLSSALFEAHDLSNVLNSTSSSSPSTHIVQHFPQEVVAVVMSEHCIRSGLP